MKFTAVVSTLLVASAAAFAPATTEVGFVVSLLTRVLQELFGRFWTAVEDLLSTDRSPTSLDFLMALDHRMIALDYFIQWNSPIFFAFQLS